MNIYKDEAVLNEKFPFNIHHLVLRKQDNNEESFHWHSFCEITYVQQGRGSYYVNGKQYEMDAGDLIIFNNVEPHGWLVEDEQMHVLVMTFSSNLVADPVKIYSNEYLKPFVERGSNFQNKIERKDPIAFGIADIMYEIMREYQRKDMGYQMMIKADTLRILTFLFRHYQKDETLGEKLIDKKNAMKRLEEAFYYINQNYTKKITLDEVAKSVYMSPNYFSSYFKKVTDKSFSDYVTKLRIKKVEELLETTDKSVMDIAMDCGFQNMSNFYRLYKKHSGNQAQLRMIRKEKGMEDYEVQ